MLPLIPLIIAAGAVVVLSGKKKRPAVKKEQDQGADRPSGTASSFRAPQSGRVQYDIRTSPAGSGPKPGPEGDAPGFGPGDCPFGFSVNRDATACVPSRLAPGWAPLHGTFSKRPDGKWASPVDVVYSFSTPGFKNGNQYTTGERYFLATVADAYGLTDMLSEKPKNWSSRTKRIVNLVANHPANRAVLRRNNDTIKFKWKVGKGKDGYKIVNLDPKKVWNDSPQNIEQRLEPGGSYGIIILPAE